MKSRTVWTSRLAIVAGIAVSIACLGVTAEAADQGDDDALKLRARAISTLNISRAASDRVEITISRWSSDDERERLVKTLLSKGNVAVAAALGDQAETGWFRFDPRGGGGPGRDPRKTALRYARDITDGDTREIVLLTNHYIGYGPDAQAADGARLAEYPFSVVLIKLTRTDDGEWEGLGRLFVGTKIRFDSAESKFVIDEFPSDPVYLKDVRVK
jgi:hypothetical protein